MSNCTNNNDKRVNCDDLMYFDRMPLKDFTPVELVKSGNRKRIDSLRRQLAATVSDLNALERISSAYGVNVADAIQAVESSTLEHAKRALDC
jgi:hypothetical protein